MAFSDKKRAFEYVNEYQKEKYDRITVMAEKGRKDVWKQAAQEHGMRLSKFVEYCVDKEINSV